MTTVAPTIRAVVGTAVMTVAGLMLILGAPAGARADPALGDVQRSLAFRRARFLTSRSH